MGGRVADDGSHINALAVDIRIRNAEPAFRACVTVCQSLVLFGGIVPRISVEMVVDNAVYRRVRKTVVFTAEIIIFFNYIYCPFYRRQIAAARAFACKKSRSESCGGNYERKENS